MKTVRILPRPPEGVGNNRPPVQTNSVPPAYPQSTPIPGTPLETREPIERTYTAYAHAVIRDLVGRESTPIERQNWVDQLVRGTKPETLPLCLFYSAEYRHLQVRRMFERTFKRPPTWDELQKWSDLVVERRSYESLWTEMLGTEEYLRRNGRSNESYVRALFRDVMDRRPEDQEVEGWRGLLDAFAATKTSLAEQFLQSREYRASMIRRWNEAYLGRGTTHPECAALLVKLEQGHSPEKIQAEILSSPEYFVRRLRRPMH